MNNEEAEIKFEREDRDGVVAVGTYLLDAARRLGINPQNEEFDEQEFIVFKVTNGGDLLSAPTKTELELLSEDRRTHGDRFASQAKIERSGEITIMTAKEKEKEAKPKEEQTREEYRKQFEELPLEKKIASLVELEVIALGDTLSFIVNSPSMIVGKVMDVMAEFGLKMESDQKKQTRPNEHQTEKDETENKNGSAKKNKKAEKKAKDAEKEAEKDAAETEPQNPS